MASPDVRFGVAVPEARCAEFAPQGAGIGTLELPLEAFRLGPDRRRPVPGWSGDLCLRLGEAFILPALDGGRGAEAVYRAAVGECRRLAADPDARDRISAFLLEFPPSLRHSAAARRHLDRTLKDLEGLPLAAAFFSPDWYSARVVEGLKARGVALCLLDLPRSPSSPPSLDVVTAPLVYVRFCGARAGGEGAAEARAAWLPRLGALAAQAEKLRVIFAPEGDAGEAEASAMASLWERRSGERGRERTGERASDLAGGAP